MVVDFVIGTKSKFETRSRTSAKFRFSSLNRLLTPTRNSLLKSENDRNKNPIKYSIILNESVKK